MRARVPSPGIAARTPIELGAVAVSHTFTVAQSALLGRAPAAAGAVSAASTASRITSRAADNSIQLGRRSGLSVVLDPHRETLLPRGLHHLAAVVRSARLEHQ